MPALDNHKHELFAQGLAEGKSAEQAYTDAGYTPNRGNATRLKSNESILKRVEELQEQAAESCLVTIEEHLSRLEELSRKAEADGSWAAAINAETHRGKASGLYIERQVSEQHHYTLETEPDEDEWESQYGKGGVEAAERPAEGPH